MARCLNYNGCTETEKSFFLMEADSDRVWDPMQQVVSLQRIPNASYTSEQTYKNILVKRKKCCCERETKRNKKARAFKRMH